MAETTIGINRVSELNNISGLGNFWMAKVPDLIATNTQTATDYTIETEKLPKIKDDGSLESNFDLLGKMTMDSISFAGDEQDIVKQRYTDGSVGITLVQDGTFAISCTNMNIAPEMCEGLLNMDKITAAAAGETTDFSSALAYGKNDKMGYISPAAVYIEFLDSPQFKGILLPYATVSSRLDPTGNKTDIWQISMNVSANECPLKYNGKVYTKKYFGVSYILVPKNTFVESNASNSTESND